jgi:hypothetical protein
MIQYYPLHFYKISYCEIIRDHINLYQIISINVKYKESMSRATVVKSLNLEGVR